MDLKQLRYFVVAGEEQNFNRAARILHVAQPALSRQIHQIEQELGLALFQRLQRGVALTDAGRMFLAHAKRIMAAVGEARSDVERMKSGKMGLLRIGYSEIGIRTRAFTESIRLMGNVDEGLELRLALMNSSDQLHGLKSDSLDIGYLYDDPAAHRDLHFKMIADYLPLLALPLRHRLAAKDRIVLEDLRGEAFVWASRSRFSLSHELLMAAFKKRGFAPRIGQEAADTFAIATLIFSGAGMGFVHPMLVDEHLPPLAYKAVEDLPVHWPIYVCWKADNASPVVRRYIDVVKDLLDRHPETVATSLGRHAGAGRGPRGMLQA